MSEALRLQEDLQAEQARRFELEKELAKIKADRAAQPGIIQELRDQIKALKAKVIKAGNKPAKVIEKPIERIVYQDRVIEKPIERVVVVKEKAQPQPDNTGALKGQITRLKKSKAKIQADADEARQAAAKAQAQLAGLQAEVNNLTDQLRARNVSSNQ